MASQRYRVTWEMDIELDEGNGPITPEEAAKTANSYMQMKDTNWFFSVKNLDSNEITDVDLEDYI